MHPIIHLKGVYKFFGEIKALEGVDFELGQNEIVGLLGDNGAGKSTLIKLITGVYRMDHGEIFIQGRKINPRKYSVHVARQFGIETVYQERSLGEQQALWRNIFIGRHVTNWLGYIAIKQEKAAAMNILNNFLGLQGAGLVVDAPAGTLSGGEQQGIAIGRAMYFNAEIIILDEPTTALSVKEVNKVLDFVQKIKDRGKSCIYITHNIYQLYAISDRFVIMDHGKVVGNYPKDEITIEALYAKLMMFAQR
jgi:simple sugar transport system ATP-binding protein